MALLWPFREYKDEQLGVINEFDSYLGSQLIIDEENQQALFFSPAYEGQPAGCYVSIFNFVTLQFNTFEVILPFAFNTGNIFHLSGGSLWLSRGQYFYKIILTSPTTFGVGYGPIYGELFDGIRNIVQIGSEVFVSGQGNAGTIAKFNASSGVFIDWINISVNGYFGVMANRNNELIILNSDPFVGTGESYLYNPATNSSYAFMQDGVDSSLWLDETIGSDLTGAALNSYLHNIQDQVEILLFANGNFGGSISYIKNIQGKGYFVGALHVSGTKFGAWVNYELTTLTGPVLSSTAYGTGLTFTLGNFYKIANKYWMADNAQGIGVTLYKSKGGWKIGSI